MMGLSFSSKLDWGSTIAFNAKTASRKIGTFIRSMKFFSMKNLFYDLAWNIVVISGMLLLVATWNYLDKLQKRICRTVGPSLTVSLEPLTHCRNLASLTLFYRYYCGRCSFELAQQVSFPYSRGRSTRYSDRLHDFSVTILRCYKGVP